MFDGGDFDRVAFDTSFFYGKFFQTVGSGAVTITSGMPKG